MNLKRAFTLIELLTVMAVSAILLTVIAIPLVQSFNLTRAGQSLSAAQAQAREMSARISADIAAAAAVRDNTGDQGSMLIVVPGRDGALEEVIAPHAKLDLFLPSRKQITGAKQDPTLAGPNGDLNLPASPGTVMVRWFLGRRDPFLDYGIPHIDLRIDAANRWQGTVNGQDNPYVLYRAEVPAYTFGPDTFDYDGDGDTSESLYQPNWNLFERGADGQPVIDDPSFFTITLVDQAAGAAQVNAKSARIRAWQRYAKNMSLNGRVDSLVFDYNLQTRILNFAGNRPVFSPAVRMQPTRVASEVAQAVNPMTSGNEAPNPARVGPAAYRIATGSWSDFALNVNQALHPSGAYSVNEQAGSPTLPWTADQSRNRALGIAKSSGGDGLLTQVPMGPTFNIDLYWRLKSQQAASAQPPYPFSGALISNYGIDALYLVPDPNQGMIQASFGVQEFGSDPAWPVGSRLPSTNPGTPAAPTPGVIVGPDDPVAGSFLTGGSYSSWRTPSIGINGRFNMLWNQWDQLVASQTTADPGALTREQFAKRFIDLRVVRQPDGSVSPLNPSRSWRRIHIVPGSETVIGPDQRPGPNFGRYVRYRRALARPVGPNEYYINYTHQIEPDWSQFNLSVNYSPLSFNEADFVQAILQAPYRAGYIELNSAPGEPLPDRLPDGTSRNGEGRIVVNYSFAFTDPNDVVLADYSTNDVVDVSVTVLNYAPTGGPNPQKITLQATAEARNVLR